MRFKPLDIFVVSFLFHATIARDVVETFTVPEGAFVYPKLIAKLPVPEDDTKCFVDSAHFAPPNGLRTINMPKLFGVMTAPYVTTAATNTTQNLDTATVIETTTIASKAFNDGRSQYSLATENLFIVNSSGLDGYRSATPPSLNLKTRKALKLSKRNLSYKNLPTEQPDFVNSTIPVYNESKNQTKLPYNTGWVNTEQSNQTTDWKPSNSVTTSPLKSILFSSVTSSFSSSVTSPSKRSNSASTVYSLSTKATTNRITTSKISSSTVSGGAFVEIVQLFDLDREKADKHFLTIRCTDNSTKSGFLLGFYLIKVSDINDNTPVFDSDSLHSQVPSNLSFGDTVIEVSATDADTGLNAELFFRSIHGTEKIRYGNGTEVYSSYITVAIVSSGFGVLLGELTPDIEITFAVVVKDRGNYSNGNRATATATVSVYGNNPPTSAPTTTTPPDTKSNWWIYVTSGVLVIVVSTIMITLVIYFKRKKQRYHEGVLVIDDYTGEELFNRNNDTEETLPNSRTDDNLINISRERSHSSEENFHI